jgi:hypothetical protein
MAIPSLPARYFFSVVGALAAAAVLAGCSGSSQVNPVGTQQSPAVTMHGPLVNPGDRTRCRQHGDVRIDVDPCSITFTPSNPGPDTLTVSVPRDKKGTISESDNCGGPSGIATVTQGSGNEWAVTAGSTTGSCTATFDYANKRGKVVGSANLSITNNI